MMITYRVTHPDLSEPVLVDGADGLTDTFISNNVWHYVLREFDVTLDRRAFTVTREVAQ